MNESTQTIVEALTEALIKIIDSRLETKMDGGAQSVESLVAVAFDGAMLDLNDSVETLVDNQLDNFSERVEEVLSESSALENEVESYLNNSDVLEEKIQSCLDNGDWSVDVSFRS